MCLVVLSVGGWWVSSLSQSEIAEPSKAAAAFDGVRAQFAGIRPALEIQDSHLTVVREPPDVTTAPTPTAVHLLVWEPNNRRLSRFTLPFWVSTVSTEPIPIDGLAQMTNGGISGLMEARRRGDELNLRLSELERYGRTLLLDGTTSDGKRIVIWND